MLEKDKLNTLYNNTQHLAEKHKNFAAVKNSVINHENIEQIKTPVRRGRRTAAAAAVLAAVFAVGFFSRDLWLPVVLSETEMTVPADDADYSEVYNTFKENNPSGDTVVFPDGSASVTKYLRAEPDDPKLSNIQGVNENDGDVVRSDGENLYVLSKILHTESLETSLTVLRTEDLSLLYRTTNFNDSFFCPEEMYLYENQLILAGYDSYDYDDAESVGKEIRHSRPERYASVVQIYNIMDGGTLEYVREFRQSGFYAASWIANDSIYLISSHQIYWNPEILQDYAEKYVPSTSNSFTGSERTLVESSNINIAFDPENIYTVISAISLSKGEEDKTETQAVLGRNTDMIFQTTTSLYVSSYQMAGLRAYKESESADSKPLPIIDENTANPVSAPAENESADSSFSEAEESLKEETYIAKFTLGKGCFSSVAQGRIPGYIINESSMDETDGNLRVVVSNDDIYHDDRNTENLLFILDESLNTISKSEIAPKGKRIESVRFIDDMIYAAERRFNNLSFAADISDPDNIKTSDEFAIQRLPAYLYRIGKDTLIGVSDDVGENGNIIGGLTISIIDMTNPANPVEKNKLVFSGECYSKVSSDHKSITYIEDKGLLLVPVQAFGLVSFEGSNIQDDINGGALVIEVSKENGLAYKGVLREENILEQDSGNMFSNVLTKRTVCIGDKLYGISDTAVLQYDMDTLEILNRKELKNTFEMSPDLTGFKNLTDPETNDDNLKITPDPETALSGEY